MCAQPTTKGNYIRFLYLSSLYIFSQKICMIRKKRLFIKRVFRKNGFQRGLLMNHGIFRHVLSISGGINETNVMLIVIKNESNHVA